MKGYGKSDIGKIRKLNEDSFFVSNNYVGKLPNLYIVADGMGGYKGGEVASSSSIKYFCEYAENIGKEEDIMDLLIGGVKYANLKIIEDARREEKRLGGMGTTFIALVVEGGRLYIAHVGDSRLYMSEGDEIIQLTTDHSYVMELVKAGKLTMEEARWHPDKNWITRALGVNGDLLVDGIVRDFNKRFILMCTDGLTNMIDDRGIAYILSSDKAPEEKVQALIQTANENGGYDNITAILIDREVDG